ncbi:hypothetical protein J6590_011382 [Homalodisca vitripennis]|nr:hypothetical protein J6590_011382 [Homalodisca vitripennis]
MQMLGNLSSVTLKGIAALDNILYSQTSLPATAFTFHHHHIHHHNPATTYPSHYPVLPSLLYSQLYHSSGPDLLSSTQLPARGDDHNPPQRTHTAADNSAVWRPY